MVIIEMVDARTLEFFKGEKGNSMVASGELTTENLLEPQQ
jgi:hypothetical protein